MAKTAPVAVVVPVFNRRLKLIKTLNSVAAQSRLPAIVIVVDDGSTDGTGEAAKSWLAINAPFEWRVVVRTNAGVSAARNAGFAHIGELPYVCFLDSDDLWPPDFIEEGLRALEGGEDIVAAVADKIKQRPGKEGAVRTLLGVASNPLLWIICNTGGILSCSMIRSSAARAAGLFVPGMVVSEDTDFLLRLFSLGGAAHSKAGPVVFVKNAPIEPTEPLNLSDHSPELKYLWARQLTVAVSRLPKPLMQEHQHLIRTAVARQWAASALSNRRAHNQRRALHCVLKAMWWDFQWGRRLRLIWSFVRSRKGVLDDFPNPFRDIAGAEGSRPSMPPKSNLVGL